MVRQIPGHTCNIYCGDGNHAVPSIGKIGSSMKDVRDSFARSAAQFGYAVVSFKPCEADPVQWAATHGVDCDLSIYDTSYVAVVTSIKDGDR